MKYRSGDAFRQALLDHLRNEVRRTGQDFQWLVRLIAFERLLARLVSAAPDQWIPKGGLALDLRMDGRARTTQDIDLAWTTDEGTAEEIFRAIRQQDHGDHFTMVVERTSLLDEADVTGTVRYRVTCELATRRLTSFHLDVNFDGSILGAPDKLSGPTILAFSDLPQITVPVISLTQHIAEKVHAYTRQYGSEGRASTRVKDLVDLVLIQAHATILAGEMRSVLEAVFFARNSQLPPGELPPPPNGWPAQYRKMAISLDIPADLNDGYQLAATFLDPILEGRAGAPQVWNPALRTWADVPQG
jgi:hypothetical protein